jgi:hypothetical protein
MFLCDLSNRGGCDNPCGQALRLWQAPFGSDFGELSRVEPQGRRQSSRASGSKTVEPSPRGRGRSRRATLNPRQAAKISDALAIGHQPATLAGTRRRVPRRWVSGGGASGFYELWHAIGQPLSPPFRLNFLEWNDRFVRKKQNSLSNQTKPTDQYNRGSLPRPAPLRSCTLRRALDA